MPLQGSCVIGFHDSGDIVQDSACNVLLRVSVAAEIRLFPDTRLGASDIASCMEKYTTSGGGVLASKAIMTSNKCPTTLCGELAIHCNDS